MQSASAITRGTTRIATAPEPVLDLTILSRVAEALRAALRARAAIEPLPRSQQHAAALAWLRDND